MKLRLLMAGAAASVLALEGAAIAGAAGLDQSGRFAPSSNPMVLTRTVWRTLVDGKQIVVTRRYRVSFVRHADGFVLEGQFLDASVEAPPILAGMAELERQRPDSVPFPLRLDPAGRIRYGFGGSDASAGVAVEAVRRGQELIRYSGLSAQQQNESAMLLGQLALQRATVTWPADLFNPGAPEQHEHRRIALPDGQEGEIDVTLKVLAVQPDGLPEAVERTVVTELGGSQKVSRERWSFEPVALPGQ